MQKMLLWRIATILLLTLLLLVPLSMIHGVVSQRSSLQTEVENTIAASSSGPQRLAGPLLVVPYTVSELIVTKDDKGRESRHWSHRNERIAFTAERAAYIGKVDVEQKYKGLYKAQVYQTNGNWRASFAVPKNLGLDLDWDDARLRLALGKAYLAFGLTDVRGLRGTPDIKWNAEPVVAENDSDWAALGDGVHASVGVLDVRTPRTHEMTMQLNVGGTRVLSIAPLGKTTSVELRAAWPHPNFGGRFLPTERSIDANGFVAKWEISQLASKNAALIASGTKTDAALEAFDVSFIEPVNVYLQAERAVKYGVLFIVLTFAAFFLFEMLKNLRIHPMQYALVGLALALFFLVLVSLSEHITFLVAYLCAATASVLLITYYLVHVLGGWARGALFGLKLALLYGVLYGLLLSEDNALMLGSLLLFAALAAVMLITRRLNWYQLSWEK
jgi:inner membrane protein